MEWKINSDYYEGYLNDNPDSQWKNSINQNKTCVVLLCMCMWHIGIVIVNMSECSHNIIILYYYTEL